MKKENMNLNTVLGNSPSKKCLLKISLTFPAVTQQFALFSKLESLAKFCQFTFHRDFYPVVKMKNGSITFSVSITLRQRLLEDELLVSIPLASGIMLRISRNIPK